MKICSRCKIEKDESEFYKDKRTKSGLYSDCKKCHYLYKIDNNKEYKNSDKYRESNKKYQRKRRKNIKHRLDGNLATTIYQCLRGKKEGRNWEKLVGYTICDLINHLESKFEPWMNWDNYGKGKGKWNVDHIKPKSLFYYTCPEDEEFKECWALSNLQPLEAIENIKKNNHFN